MSRLRISLLLFSTIATLPTLCMHQKPQLTQWKLRPYVQKNNMQIDHLRDMLQKQDVSLAPRIHPHVKIVGYAENDESLHRCDYFAIKRATGSTKNTTMQDRVRFVENNCTQNKKPKPNDIVLFTPSETDLEVKHLAIVQSIIKPKKKHWFSANPKPIIIVESKWGENPEILAHTPFASPSSYGKACGFFTPNDTSKNQRL